MTSSLCGAMRWAVPHGRAPRLFGAMTSTTSLFCSTRIALAPAGEQTPSASPTSSRATRRTGHRHYATAPPLRLLSWEVDGMETTHRHCQRRLCFADRIPFIVETIAQCAPDVVALQNSTAGLADALCGDHGADAIQGAGREKYRFQLDQKELLERLSGARPRVTGESTTASIATPEQANVTADDSDEVAGDADSVVSCSSPGSPQPSPRPRYALIGAAVNGRCGEVQLFVRVGCGLEATRLPSGPGVSALFRWTHPHDEKGATTGTNATTTAAVDDASPPSHNAASTTVPPSSVQFVLSSVDLSYRGKSISLDGSALSTAQVSLDGSPFTLRTHADGEDDNTGTARGFARSSGQLEPHREAALTFLSNAVQPDIICGNTFMGRGEVVPHYEDAWLRGGAPVAQERTTNTLRSHSRDRTNYWYFVPSPTTADTRTTTKASSVHRHDSETNQIAHDETGAASLPIGTPLPLNAVFDAKCKLWRLPDAASPSSSTTSTSAATNLTVPEVAGRFQRCLLCRGRATRTHTRHFSFVQRYRRCRVVVVKPFLEVPLTAEWERDWQAARLCHSRRRKLERKRHALERKRRHLAHATDVTEQAHSHGSPPRASDSGEDADGEPEEAGEEVTSVPDTDIHDVERQLEQVSQQLAEIEGTTVAPEKVYTSLSDQFPLLVVLQ